MDAIATVAITRWTPDGLMTLAKDEVLTERELTLHVNEKPPARMSYTPGGLRELLVGYLYTEGYVARIEDVLSLEMDEGTGAAFARLAEPGGLREPRALPALAWDPRTVQGHARALLDRSTLFKRTGNVHSALLARGKDVLAFGEDMGRFNAIDKCVGEALLKGEFLGDCVILTSGRLPLGMALKVARAGVPVAVSRSAPTTATLDFAARVNLQVVGFARGEGMNVYFPKLTTVTP